ncbi:microtubule organization protein AKNA isoform X2 [Polyodon spathula]|uniref:microtubule organization protein AKNA isoform X2 n=1 Tax=Polyodon spathula TaxID=7913 RepID=UPI001B7F469C|nr:microtubule organization protein AKNA isoform X2 [Polyodon spathula]
MAGTGTVPAPGRSSWPGSAGARWDPGEASEGDEEFQSLMDENGIIGLEDMTEGYLQELEGAGELSEAGTPDPEEGAPRVFPSSGFEQQQDSLEDLSSDFNELLDSDPLQLFSSPDNELHGERQDDLHDEDEDDEDDLDEDLSVSQGEPRQLQQHQHWLPERDKQLDMTEDEREAVVSEGGQSEGDRDSESEREEYPDLPYDGRLDLTAARQETSLEDFEDYSEAAHGSTGFDEDFLLSEVEGNSPARLQGELGNRRETSGETFSRAQEDLPSILRIQRQEMPTTPPKMGLSQTLLSRISTEDLANGPDIEAETIPETSFSDSVEDSLGNAARGDGGRKASPRGSLESGSEIERPRESPLFREELPADPEWEANIQKSPPAPSSSSTPHTQRKAHSPPAKPSVVSRQPRSVSPVRARRPQRDGSPKPLSGRSSVAAENLRYGQGQLNFPLPDFSKVEPRVRFPKAEESGYKPPKGRVAPRKSFAAAEPPLVFKSPAEIVMEVLLSSPQGPAPPRRPHSPDAKVPEEFKSPQQATELVHQLQEDYNKLLTKYAEAENTIDRMRLGAKVSLYADPPKPSHSVHMGALHQGSKVLTLTIPQLQKAQLSQPPDPALLNSASSVQSGSVPEDCTPTRSLEPGVGQRLTEALAKQAGKFSLQVDSFEDLIRAGNLNPYDQLKGFASLRQAQEALERGYLQAREEHRRLQQQGAEPGDFDPNREVEGEIFRLGMRLEDLKDRIDQTMQSQPSPALLSPEPLQMDLSTASHPQTRLHTPAARTRRPESALVKASPGTVCVEVSSVSGDSAGEEEDEGEVLPHALPEPLRHKHCEVEGEFSNLLQRYHSFRGLSELMEPGLGSELTASPQEGSPSQGAEWTEPAGRSPKGDESRTAPLPQPMESKAALLGQPRDHSVDQSEPQQEESLLQDSSLPGRQAMSSRGGVSKGGGDGSRRSSVTSVGESGATQYRPWKVLRHNKTAPPQERIVSPETDSGFVGSESSRFTPAVHSPEHQRARRPFTGRDRVLKALPRPVQQPPLSAPRRRTDTAGGSGSAPKTGPLTRARRHSMSQPGPSRSSAPQHWSESVSSEFEPDAYATRSESEGEGQSVGRTYLRPARKLQYEQLPSPSSTPSPLRIHTQRGPQTAHTLPARHKAIQALQGEVSRLRHLLEESLHRPHTPPFSTAPPASGRLPVQDEEEEPRHRSAPLRFSQVCQDEFEEPKSPAQRARSTSIPQLRPELQISSDSDNSQRDPRTQSSKPVPGFSASNDERKHPRTGTQEAVTFRGPYTGNSSVRAPSAHPKHSCPPRCPLCRGSGVHSPQGNTDQRAPGVSAKREAGSSLREGQRMGAPHKERGGVYLPFHAPPVFSYVPPVQFVPYSPAHLYFSTPASKAPPPSPESRLYLSMGVGLLELRPEPGVKGRHRRSLTLDSAEVDALSRSLSRAVEAAQSMRMSTGRMARSLTTELSRSSALRQSSLY